MILLLKSSNQVHVGGYVTKQGTVVESHYRRAAKFAAAKHTGQLRKDGKTRYIAHPVTVANILAREGGISDETTLIAALLHDTIEDTGTTHAELVREFGADVADTVQAVTNDESLPKAEQKAAQIDKASKYPTRAAHLKMADKIANLRDILKIPPKGWDAARKLAYYDHAKAVVDVMPDPHPALKRAFDYAYQKGADQLRAMIGETGCERHD
jgi:guanosine-3',5'-bis(diphosphate) 3'-pyrophosphohydrolase